MAQKTPAFRERCYAILKRVPRGKVTTYKELARAMGTRGCRAVGNALHVNPYWPKVPCHRVVTSSGDLGGFAQGRRRKMLLLTAEGIEISPQGKIDLKRYLYRFPI